MNRFMSVKLINHQSLSMIVFLKRSIETQSTFDLGKEMKVLNDKEQFLQALQLFDQHNNNDNMKTCSSSIITQALKACAQIGDLRRGSSIHQLVSDRIQNNRYILASLIHLYMQCGDVTHAQLLFNESKNKALPIYGVMMKGYIKNNQVNQAIDLFNQIENPDAIIFNLLFNACAQQETEQSLRLAKKVYEEMPESFHSNSCVLTSMLDVSMKCGDVSYAESLFNKSTKKELAMYAAMMRGYTKNNRMNKAIDLFNAIKRPDEIIYKLFFNACGQQQTEKSLNLIKTTYKKLPKSFHSNSYVLNSVFDALINCGDCSSAEVLHSKMTKSVENYGNLMNGFNKTNNAFKTFGLFKQMKHDGIEGNLLTYICVIKALSLLGFLRLCRPIVEQIPHSLLSNNQIQVALVDMWGKTGCVDQAKQVFESISQLDTFGYNAMIDCYGWNGMGDQAIELYRKMPEELIDEVTHVRVLNACSQSGLVDEARSIFQNIQIKTERIYSTMVDCLSRASFHEEAEELIDQYELSHPLASSMYLALLAGARNEKKTLTSKLIYNRMKKLFPEEADPVKAAVVLLADVYKSSSIVGKPSDIQIQLDQPIPKRKISLTWTSVNGEAYQFRPHDKSHPRSSEIYTEAKKISKELIEHGHKYDSAWISRPLNKGETIESVLSGHSERLAIAWNFVENPNASQIQLSNNIRICGDCHQAIKLIAKIRQCEIVIRDASLIHRFQTNGQCSCNDHL